MNNKTASTFGTQLSDMYILYSLNDSIDLSGDQLKAFLNDFKQNVSTSHDTYLMSLTAIALTRAGMKFDAWMIAYRLSFELDPDTGRAKSNMSMMHAQGEGLVLETTCIALQALMMVDSQKFSHQIDQSMEYVLHDFLDGGPSAQFVCLETIRIY